MPSTHAYVERTGAVTRTLTSSDRRIAGGWLLSSVDSAGNRHRVEVDDRMETLWWEFDSPERATHYRVVREQRWLLASGILEGRPIDLRIESPSGPWYQSIERSLQRFALDGRRRELSFWAIEPYTLAPTRLVARTVGVEWIRGSEGGRIEAERIDVSLAGPLAPFWSTRYWFRIGDGLFVRSEGARGAPGTPVTVVALAAP